VAAPSARRTSRPTARSGGRRCADVPGLRRDEHAAAEFGWCRLIEMLNVLEGFDLAQMGAGSADTMHHVVEAMRRSYADRARYLGDPDANPEMPVDRLISKAYAASLRRGIRADRAGVSSPDRFEWPAESDETTHLSSWTPIATPSP